MKHLDLRARAAWLVVDLGFGDAGKGATVDWLARHTGARLVVRANGGAQAGHNVYTAQGQRHTFAQWGAASFVPGVRTLLGPRVVVHPSALLAEAAALESVGVRDPLSRLLLHRDAALTTPVQQCCNRLRELARGEGRHGSCGVGFGETVQDREEGASDLLFARDLRDPARLERAVRSQQARRYEALRAELAALPPTDAARRERALLEDAELAERWVQSLAPLRARAEELLLDEDSVGALLRREGAVLFEGAQGVLLDEWWGFHPHTTWSTCTFEEPLAMLARAGREGPAHRLGVLRSYTPRHGAGPLPTERCAWEGAPPEPDNALGPWQGSFRAGALDLPLLRYAVEVCGGVDALALTHLDALSAHERWTVCEAYESAPVDERYFVYRDGAARTLRPGARGDLAWQQGLGEALRSARPRLRALPGRDAEERGLHLAECLEDGAGAPVWLRAWGRTAEQRRWGTGAGAKSVEPCAP